MLLPDNMHPEYSVYYNGAFVLAELQKNKIQGLLDLYQKVKKHKDMSFSVFILCLDWIFLLDVAKLNKDDKIELCS